MKVERLAIPDVLLLTPTRFGDTRGFFSETFHAARMADAGVDAVFVQDNHSHSQAVGTLRGLHCQVAPHVQGKLVRAVRGAIWDVAVDARRGSPHFGKHVAAELSAANWQQLWIPGGFLHAFVTLEPDTEVVYKTTDYYDKASERGIIWNDPDLAIEWPIPGEDLVLSDKDQILPRWAEMGDWFAV
jgi:dTDP-4-dehydrorhamnose 3,5-epimerase